MGNLTIASAFRLRNKLKERIKKLSARINQADAVKDTGTVENTSLFDGRTFAETIKAVDTLMSSIWELNLAVDTANVVNRADLIALETIKAKIALFEEIADKCRTQEKFRYEYNTEGGKDKIALESLLDQRAIVSRLEELKKNKEALEEKLAESNFRTAVNFDANSVQDLL